MKFFLMMSAITCLFGPYFFLWDWNYKDMWKPILGIIALLFISGNIAFAIHPVIPLADFYSWKY